MLIKNIAALWMVSPEWDELAQNSRNAYMHAFKHLAPVLEMDADDVRRATILDLRDKLYAKRGSCALAIKLLSRIINYGYDRSLCDFNHCRNIKMPKVIPRERWSDAEIEQFLTTAKPYLKQAIMLALYTGQRRCDIIAMRWEQYDGDMITMKQQKTNRLLRLPVHPALKEMLDALPRYKDSYILHNAYGKPWSLNSLSTAIKLRCKKLGFKGRTIHGIRKTTASKLAEAGCSPAFIGSVTGHATIQEIIHYSKAADQERMARKAIKAWAESDH